jgi:predicted dithiol-disulfide oxidoreductase (DUF899 family)
MGEIQNLEKQIYEMSTRLGKLRRENQPVPIENYTLKDLDGDVTILDLFGGKETMFVIHNMGQGCRYCTLWADGINAFLPHLEDQFSVVLMSKDAPEVQRQFANARGWRFRMASHGKSPYFGEQTGQGENKNNPGLVCYVRKGEKIFKKNTAEFGPGDQFCSLWHFLSLAGVGTEDWTPQYNYWQRPAKLDDGGANLR